MNANEFERDLITKITTVIPRADGSEVKIVATKMGNAVDTFVMRRDSSQDPWILCSDAKDPEWRTMPLDDYEKFGRSEKLRTVSHGELLRTISFIGQPMSALN